jgi:hypothetical protein
VDGEFRAAQAAAESKRAEQERATAAADMSGEEASAS